MEVSEEEDADTGYSVRQALDDLTGLSCARADEEEVCDGAGQLVE